MLPDFLCIGAQKAGTTWLYENIKDHPQVWLPPVKEINYFSDLSPLSVFRQAFVGHRPGYRRRIIQQLIKLRRLENARRIGWYLPYFFQPRDDIWYASLFRPGKGQIAGDISPFYAVLNETQVARVYRLMPEAKIIYILRNPIYRTWSSVAMYFSGRVWGQKKYWGYQGLENEEEQICQIVNRQMVFRQSNYLMNLQNWEEYYPQNQIYIGFFDELALDPASFLKDIYSFLELDDSDRYIPKTVQQKRNARQYPEIPAHFAAYLAGQYYDQLVCLQQCFANPYTAAWLEEAEKYLEKAR